MFWKRTKKHTLEKVIFPLLAWDIYEVWIDDNTKYTIAKTDLINKIIPYLEELGFEREGR